MAASGSALERVRRENLVWPSAQTTAGTEDEPVMRVVVDYDLCESNALCMGVAPEVFEVREDDNLYILNENPPEEMRDKVEQAVRLCPKAAISIED
jgi:ferredoxin